MDNYVSELQEFAPKEPFVLNELIDRQGILALHLSYADGRAARLAFDACLAYRKLDEGDRMAGLDELSGNAQSGRSFYRVMDSDFVDWFVQQGYGTRSSKAITHYVVITVDEFIDVLSLSAPTFSLG